MKIAKVETYQFDKWLLVTVTTDNGIVGVGECGLWSFPESAAAVVNRLGEVLVGADALAPERVYQFVNRFSHFRGSAIASALSAIDIALWDAMGQYFEQPIYRLMGGPVRDRIRLYVHIVGSTADELATAAQSAIREGFTAVRFDPFMNSWPTDRVSALVEFAEQQVATVRRAIGPAVDICLECHFKLTPGTIAMVTAAFAPYRIMFLEDPFPPESNGLFGRTLANSPVPIATGERLSSLGEFSDLLDTGAVGYIRPDVCLIGGLTQGRKVAALAESRGVDIVPHNWLSPVNTAASVQLDAVVPNFAIQEYTSDVESPKNSFVPRPVERDGGYLVLPREPGLGIDVDLSSNVAARPIEIITPVMPDGAPAHH